MMSIKPVTIITGAARGIGRGCAIALANAGFNLLINDLPDKESREKLSQAKAELEKSGAEVECFCADIADITQHEVLLDIIEKRWGRFDCLVNNAGITVKKRGDLLDITPESFDRNIQVNTRAPFFLAQAFSRRLIKQKEDPRQHRSIIFITSINAVMMAMNRGEYTLAKTASSASVKLFATRLSPLSIGVYEVRPGLIKTDMTIPATQYYDQLIAKGLVPQGRWGEPEDVASTVRAMAEGKLRYTCGLSVLIDGGLSMPRF
ncbi:3-ketoacyl-ACP reductase [Salmonella enterica]|nr:3-ketoacyl-ACP reductase [Salmonella enterica]